ncbi:hypothetical protein H920_06145 [Fukomys damarensis]|uniref:Uncharacterized protein n=1 Tax=Fukomys damarensis TaxID=885580 RepID=A0A091EB01_FUKDA|nr:hypothetical protein H920_06145 [Fukomys damarensis]
MELTHASGHSTSHRDCLGPHLSPPLEEKSLPVSQRALSHEITDRGSASAATSKTGDISPGARAVLMATECLPLCETLRVLQKSDHGISEFEEKSVVI